LRRSGSVRRLAKQVGRKGTSLSSGEDIEICPLVALKGQRLVCTSALKLEHLISESRLAPSYIERLVSDSSREDLILGSYLAARKALSGLGMYASGSVYWGSSATNLAGGTFDTRLTRSAAGVVEASTTTANDGLGTFKGGYAPVNLDVSPSAPTFTSGACVGSIVSGTAAPPTNLRGVG